MNRTRDACSLPSMPRQMLDDIVLNALEQCILAPDHLTKLLGGLLEKSDAAETRRRRALADARAARTEAQKAVTNLIKLIENGALATEIDGIERQLRISKRKITPMIVRQFGLALSSRLRDGDANFRRAYVALLVDKVELSTETVLICGTRGCARACARQR